MDNRGNTPELAAEACQEYRPSTSHNDNSNNVSNVAATPNYDQRESYSPPQNFVNNQPHPNNYQGQQPLNQKQTYHSRYTTPIESRHRSMPQKFSLPPQGFQTPQPFLSSQDYQNYVEDSAESSGPQASSGQQQHSRVRAKNQGRVTKSMSPHKKGTKKRMAARISDSFNEKEDEESLMVDDYEQGYNRGDNGAAHRAQMDMLSKMERQHYRESNPSPEYQPQRLPTQEFTSTAYESLYGGQDGEGFGRFSCATFPKVPGMQPFEGQGDMREPVHSGGADSGRSMRDLSNVPIMVERDEISDAYLKKRGIDRPASGKKVCKRGYGASDPENIRIVNLREFQDLNFEQIKNILNKERIARGHDPRLTTTGVANRYGRTGPLLFASQNLQWIPLNQRRGKNMNEAILAPKVNWTGERDSMLVDAVKEWEATKWEEVAKIFNQKSGCNADVPTVSSRWILL